MNYVDTALPPCGPSDSSILVIGMHNPLQHISKEHCIICKNMETPRINDRIKWWEPFDLITLSPTHEKMVGSSVHSGKKVGFTNLTQILNFNKACILISGLWRALWYR